MSECKETLFGVTNLTHPTIDPPAGPGKGKKGVPKPVPVNALEKCGE